MRCAECRKTIQLGHRYCDCGAVLCTDCRDDHVSGCDADEALDDDGGLGLSEGDDL